MEENGIIYTDLGPDVSKARSLAIFLKSCTRIDKRLLGDFISKPENLDVLKEFMGLFDFKDVSASLILKYYADLLDRNLSLRLCGNFLKPFGYLEKLSRSLALQKPLPSPTLHLAQVRILLENSTLFVFGRLIQVTAEIKSGDATHVLSYSIIMLNTDQHNPQIRVGVLSCDTIILLTELIQETYDN